jgi:hypothetical protein
MDPVPKPLLRVVFLNAGPKPKFSELLLADFGWSVRQHGEGKRKEGEAEEDKASCKEHYVIIHRKYHRYDTIINLRNICNF